VVHENEAQVSEVLGGGPVLCHPGGIGLRSISPMLETPPFELPILRERLPVGCHDERRRGEGGFHGESHRPISCIRLKIA
jgi:hypothetical protein